MSSKLDQVQQKVEVLASRDTPFGTGNSQVSIEAAVLMQNIHRVVQVSCILESVARPGLHGCLQGIWFNHRDFFCGRFFSWTFFVDLVLG